VRGPEPLFAGLSRQMGRLFQTQLFAPPQASRQNIQWVTVASGHGTPPDGVIRVKLDGRPIDAFRFQLKGYASLQISKIEFFRPAGSSGGNPPSPPPPRVPTTPGPPPPSIPAPPGRLPQIPTACGHSVSPAAYAKWQQMGAERGRLVCATMDE